MIGRLPFKTISLDRGKTLLDWESVEPVLEGNPGTKSQGTILGDNLSS